MPRRDRTGPQGQGAMTGRRLGYCRTSDTNQYATGFMRGNGSGRQMRMGTGQTILRENNLNQNTLLQEIERLQKELNRINQELDSIKDIK